MRLVIDNKIPYIRSQAERLGEVTYAAGSEFTPELVKDADALIVRTRTQVNRSLLEGSNVKLVVTATIGFDHIDTEYLEQAGIAWTNCPGCNAGSVAQYVESALILLHREGIINLSNSTIGIVGVGHVGTKVAKVAAELGCSVLRCDPPRQAKEGGYFVSLAEIQQRADIITFHTPLTSEGEYATLHMAGETFFNGTKCRPVIINTSRGEVIKTEALLQALEQGIVRAAVIDTWEGEPHINRDLLQKSFIATPHIAGYSADGKANATRMSLEAVARFFGINMEFDIQPPTLPEGVITSDDVIERKLQFYNPLDDSQKLKANPEDFEHLREQYPLRREK